ncbi:ABC transporter ATP-binding protein [Euzebya tangerina]|uniref:ABC transporter ATP-binding protein n=1 Tax=Euzebya tangerina TaxID=591198 RepID=UPI000E32159E|nr:ABC transporter ATP-binding protein [Euzebya tangerina]
MADVPLSLTDLRVAFGGNVVMDGVDVAFEDGFNGLIGPNGAGKTTLFNVVNGYVRPDRGEVRLFDELLDPSKQARVVAAGVGRTFQAPRLVDDITARANVLLGMHQRYRTPHVLELLGIGRGRTEEHDRRQEAEGLLKKFGLGAEVDQVAGNLPLGSQKLVEVARALACEPRVLLLDEPAAGLGATDTDRLLAGLREVMAARDLCVVIIEHDLQLVMDLCHIVSVLHEGRIIAHADPATVAADPHVIEAYLGASVAADR